MRNTRKTTILTGPILGLVLAGCAEGAPATELAVRDSAGVAIVESSDGPGPPRWTVGAPSLVIGAGAGVTDGDGFGLIAGVVRFDDGTIGVADAAARTIRLFTDSGEPLESAGRRGEGPGEFEGLAAMWRIDGRQAGVWDARLGRVTTLASDGELGPPVSLEATGERARHTPIGVFADGRLLAWSDARELLGGDYYRADLRLLTFDSTGAVDDTLATVPGAEMWDWVWEMGTTPALIPFGRSTGFAVSGDVVYVGANEGYQIDRYDAGGRLTARWRLDREPAPLSAARVEAYKQEERDKATSSQVGKGGNDLPGRMAEVAPYPELLSHYSDLIVDSEDRLWVHDVPGGDGEPTRFTVFGSDGAVLGRAEFPPEFTPREIRGGRALGVWRDELDVEHVRIYDLVER